MSLLDEQELLDDLSALGLDQWPATLLPLIRDRLADGAHGDLVRWKATLDALPAGGLGDQDPESVKTLLQQLSPWRKGPFDVHGIAIDAEWRSDLKWRRLIDHIAPLQGRRILDVGSGNGWYALQMLKAGAARIIGIDPTVLFVIQFEAIRKLTGVSGAHVLPLRLEDLPTPSRAFDSTFSMGVLYHRRDPHEHLNALRETLASGGELILETLVLPGDERRVLEPEDRYARMRNVWHLPTIPLLEDWLRDAGFSAVRLIDASPTTTGEQRSTEWMSFESLAQALDPDNPSLTVEGLPAPLRAIICCTAP